MRTSVAPVRVPSRHLFARLTGTLRFPADRKSGEICPLIKTQTYVRLFITSPILPRFAVLPAEVIHDRLVANSLDFPLRFLIAFALFWLTVETFNPKVTVTFYATMLALFAAFAYPVDPSGDKVPASPH